MNKAPTSAQLPVFPTRSGFLVSFGFLGIFMENVILFIRPHNFAFFVILYVCT